MWAVCKKEIRQFLGSLTGIIAMAVFLLLNGLFLFVFPNSNLLDYGYASLSQFFELAPWIFLLLVPAITMRTLSDEFKSGTYEILQTKPLSKWQLISGKFIGSLLIVFIAIIPSFIYAVTIQMLTERGSIDWGATMGSYIGLFSLAAVFTAIGICCSSLTNNAVVAFIISAFVCYILYSGFNAMSKLPVFASGADYYIELLGIDFHYRSMSRGVIDLRDVIFFVSMVFFFLFFTQRNLLKR
jgi:ABC-2 type transport system permease protein